MSDIRYPWIGISDIKNVVYFTSKNCGTLLISGNDSMLSTKVGISLKDYWIETQFKTVNNIVSKL